jgi:hypothetical protein
MGFELKPDPSRPLHRVDYTEAERRYLAGETTVAIAKTWAVSATAVANGLKRRGVVMRKHWEVEPYPKNLQRSNAKKKARTHCRRGHEYTPENTWIDGRGSRNCRECMRANSRVWKRANRKPAAPRVRKDTRGWVACPDCGERRFVQKFPLAPRRCKPCQYAAMRKGEMRTCPCGTQFYVTTKKRPNAQWCSRACRKTYGGYEVLAVALSAKRKGDGNPAFKHGKRAGVNIPGWKLSRKGDDCCRNCGAHKTSKCVELHHAIPRSKCRATRADLRNGLPLCIDCHRGWHRKKVVIYRDLFTAEEWAFISSAKLTGENIEPWLERHYPPRTLAVAA